MLTEIADKTKVLGKARVLQHAPSVTTNREYPTGCNGMMFIQHETVWAVWNRALVNDGLAVILTGTL